MANGFNEYFTNIGPNLASSIDDSNTLFVKPAKSKLDRFKLVSVSGKWHGLYQSTRKGLGT